MHAEKDIVIIASGGGMMGVFTAGVLKVVHEQLRDRVGAVYAASAGADVSAFFIAGQPEIPFRFFTRYLTRPAFIRRNIIAYLYKIFFVRDRQESTIPDFIDIDYVVDVAANSPDCRLDTRALAASPIAFFVKVVDIKSGRPTYLPTNECLFQKLKATSTCGPFSTVSVSLNGVSYIDGDTIPSSIDIELARSFADKTVIYIDAGQASRVSKIILYPLYRLAGYALGRLFGGATGDAFVRHLFTDPREELCGMRHVVYIENKISASTFCIDQTLLRRVYEHGAAEATRLLCKYEPCSAPTLDPA